jgi:hypothetical protein
MSTFRWPPSPINARKGVQKPGKQHTATKQFLNKFIWEKLKPKKKEEEKEKEEKEEEEEKEDEEKEEKVEEEEKGRKGKKKRSTEKRKKHKEKKERKEEEEDESEGRSCIKCKVVTTDKCIGPHCRNFIHKFCGTGPKRKKRCGHCK